MSSLFIRKRGNNYNVIVEFINGEGKKKQKSMAKCKTEEHAKKIKKELRQNDLFLKKYGLKTFHNDIHDIPNKHKKFFVYRFLSYEGLVLYVGSTIDINKRMKGHSHLPKRCYENTYKVQYIEVNTFLDMLLLEIYYINKYNTKYNKVDKYDGGTLLDIQVSEWKDFDMNKFTPLHNY